MATGQTLDGKVAVVTGGGSGIGRASSVALAAAGAKVMVSDISLEGATATADLIRAAGGEADVVRTDVAVADECRAMVDATVDRFGGLHILHANAGIAGLDVDGPTASLDIEKWDRLIAINLSGVFYCCHFAIPAIADSGGGSIINMGSSMSSVPLGFTDAYAAAKGGVALLTKSMCASVGPLGIRVNALGPGYVDTPMNAAIWGTDVVKDAFDKGHAMGLQTSQEIADLVVFLASDASRSLTGALLTCDRGWTAFKSPEMFR